MTSWLAFIIVIVVLIVVHELGHFMVAKAVGVRVEEFSLGFGPRLVGVKRGGTHYNLRLLPLGGYVKMGGMQPEDRPRPDDFQARPISARLAAILAGPMMNFILAGVLFAVLLGAVGIAHPVLNRPTVGQTIAGYPAAKAGLKPGDEIVRVNQHPVANWNVLVHRVDQSSSKVLVLGVLRDGRMMHISVVPRKVQGRLLIGIYPPQVTVRLPWYSAIGQGFADTGRFTASWFTAIAHSIQQHRAPAFTGPVGIYGLIGQAAHAGYADLLSLTAVLSTNLGIINLLPFPSLDGSWLVFLGIEAFRKRPIDPARQGVIQMIGLAALLIFIMVLTVHDLTRLGAG